AVSIVSWKQGSTAIGWSYMTGRMESQYSGIVNIESKQPFSPAFTVETMDLINDIGFFEWYEENPMEKQVQQN
ncbi:MAG: hypothetical protein K2G60_06700, partial [Oscillospiraceae bacterium]|nr:hypothetical protein [Oscillospiraceae bacterium]